LLFVYDRQLLIRSQDGITGLLPVPPYWRLYNAELRVDYDRKNLLWQHLECCDLTKTCSEGFTLKVSEYLSFTPGFSPVIGADGSEVNRFNGFSETEDLSLPTTSACEKRKPLKRFLFLIRRSTTGLKPGVNERQLSRKSMFRIPGR
jgi:hypothetical protein